MAAQRAGLNRTIIWKTDLLTPFIIKLKFRNVWPKSSKVQLIMCLVFLHNINYLTNLLFKALILCLIVSSVTHVCLCVWALTGS